jgi:hypothetical protein
MTATIAAAKERDPLTAASSAAAASSMANGWVIWASNSPGQRRRLSEVSWFGP